MNEKKNTTTKQKPEHEIRCGDIAISIFHRQSNCGFPYWDYMIQRCYKAATSQKSAKSASFFDQNEAEILQAVAEASAWIRKKVAEASLGESPALENQDAS